MKGHKEKVLIFFFKFVSHYNSFYVVGIWKHTGSTSHIWKLEGSLHSVCPGDGTQVCRLGGKRLIC